jgi:hypothetical protein
MRIGLVAGRKHSKRNCIIGNGARKLGGNCSVTLAFWPPHYTQTGKRTVGHPTDETRQTFVKDPGLGSVAVEVQLSHRPGGAIVAVSSRPQETRMGKPMPDRPQV